jgi:hypothetical protein
MGNYQFVTRNDANKPKMDWYQSKLCKNLQIDAKWSMMTQTTTVIDANGRIQAASNATNRIEAGPKYARLVISLWMHYQKGFKNAFKKVFFYSVWLITTYV